MKRTIVSAIVVVVAAAVVHGEEIRVGFALPGGGYRVETVALETYVARVLAGEAARDSAPAALDALAIAIRTFALANRGRHRADRFDLCDQTHCQVVRTATASTEAAAARTAGVALLHGGVPASIYYTASCGGRTEMPSAVWPGADDPPYLPVQADDACGGGPLWDATIRETDLLRALHSAGFRGDRLRRMEIASRDRSGRVARLRLEGLDPGEISGQDLRVAVGRSLGWQHIKSAAFDLQHNSGTYWLHGRGSGHGVGLCVVGSARLAAAGESADSILHRYFPGLDIANASGLSIATGSEHRATPRRPAATDVAVSLPDEDEGARLMIEQTTMHERDRLAQRFGMSRAMPIAVRVHATTESFERATGRPWFTSGAIVRGELHLLPLAALRERGVLERTIRHELVHALTDDAFAGRPLWVREGAAVYFADPREEASSAPRHEKCPDDAEFARPVSIGALANAYARARACFARQIARGKRWNDVK